LVADAASPLCVVALDTRTVTSCGEVVVTCWR
jgi:hypothetical protein